MRPSTGTPRRSAIVSPPPSPKMESSATNRPLASRLAWIGPAILASGFDPETRLEQLSREDFQQIAAAGAAAGVSLDAPPDLGAPLDLDAPLDATPEGANPPA